MPKKFLRTKELHKLNTFFERNSFECIFLYGRRRLGKTYLISEFIKDKDDVFFFTCVKSNEINFEVFANELKVVSQIPYNSSSFVNWETALNALYLWAKEKKHPVIVFDEFPYICDNKGVVESIFQKYIDRFFNKINAYIIFCGSQLHLMQELISNVNRPLFLRKTEEIKLDALNYFDSCSIFEDTWPKLLEDQHNCSIDTITKMRIEQLKVYMTVGGIPYYLEKALKYNNYEEFINKEFLQGQGIASDLTTIIASEFDNSYIYNDIIKLISSGKNKYNEIQSAVRTESSVTSFLKRLESINYIENIQPIAFTPAKKNIYIVKDTLFDFFYKIIYSAILGNISKTWFVDNQDKFSSYFGNKFEKVCGEFVFVHDDKWKSMFDFNVWKAGRWWGNDKKNKTETDIDVLCINERKDEIILCDCKWTNEVYHIDSYIDINNKKQIFHNIPQMKQIIFLFSREGFSPDITNTVNCNSTSNKIIFFDINDLFFNIKNIQNINLRSNNTHDSLHISCQHEEPDSFKIFSNYNDVTYYGYIKKEEILALLDFNAIQDSAKKKYKFFNYFLHNYNNFNNEVVVEHEIIEPLLKFIKNYDENLIHHNGIIGSPEEIKAKVDTFLDYMTKNTIVNLEGIKSLIEWSKKTDSEPCDDMALRSSLTVSDIDEELMNEMSFIVNDQCSEKIATEQKQTLFGYFYEYNGLYFYLRTVNDFDNIISVTKKEQNAIIDFKILKKTGESMVEIFTFYSEEKGQYEYDSNIINHGCKVYSFNCEGKHNNKKLITHLDKCSNNNADLVILTDNIFLSINIIQEWNKNNPDKTKNFNLLIKDDRSNIHYGKFENFIISDEKTISIYDYVNNDKLCIFNNNVQYASKNTIVTNINDSLQYWKAKILKDGIVTESRIVWILDLVKKYNAEIGKK